MSVTTTADKKINEAKVNLNNAYKALLVVLDEDTWGHSELSEYYIEELFSVAGEILKLKKKL
jgi:hypothetical protein